MSNLFGGETDDSGTLVNFGDDTVTGGSGEDEHVFDPTYGGTYTGGGNEENVFDPTFGGTMKVDGGGYDFGNIFKNVNVKDVNDYLKGNRGLLSLIGGAGLTALGVGDAKKTPTIYQGGIPNLVATRNMISAPPVGRRPGAGGIDYGGDVTYTRAPKGQDPWANLRGDSARIIDPQGQANVLKGTGGTDPQSMANKISYNLPQGWSSYGPQEKIAWFNANNVTYDQLRAAGVPQSDIDYMWSNGYTSGRPANWGKTTTTGGSTVTTGGTSDVTGGSSVVTGGSDTVSGGAGLDSIITGGTVLDSITGGSGADTISSGSGADTISSGSGSDSITGGSGIDDLVAAQNQAQTQADTIGLKLPSDWSTYDAAKKIAWFNSNKITPEQLASAGIDQATIDYMKQNGYGSTPATVTPTQSQGLMSALSQGLTEDKYISNIKDYLTSNSGASDAAVRAQMDAYGISPADVAKALGQDVNKIQDKYNNAFTQGTAQQKADAYNDLLKQGLTNDQIRASIEKTAGKQTDEDWSYLQNLAKTPPKNAGGSPPAPPVVSGTTKSAGLMSAIEQGMSQDQYISNIKNWLTNNSTASDAEVYKQMKEYGIGAEDVASALGVPVSTIQGKINALTQQGDISPAPAIQTDSNLTPKVADQSGGIKDIMDRGISNSIRTVDDLIQQLGNPEVTQETVPSPEVASQSPGLQSALSQGMTQDQYIGNIKGWLTKNSSASDAEVFKQMQEYGIGAEDVAAALGVPVSTIENKIQALQQPAQSSGMQSAIKQGMSEDQYIGNIKNWLTQNSTASDSEVFQQMQEYGIGADDVARALGVPVSVIQSKIDALGGNNYASGGMAQGRYLQGGTDGMADEIPAQIGEDQPAALSHGEFVIPADVVSHMGNGNSDAGAKKLYEMMDRIRMARTGSKEQGKKIDPDSFMPGGLAKAYVGGGTVKNFATGGTTTAPAGVTGTQAGFSNWAGDYATNLMGQGQALANMPYQAYMGPLTAGPSALQNKVSQGLQGVNFPGTLGQSFTSAGAPTIGADGQPVGGGGIASSYMNPYLKNVLDPQLEELRRQSQINLQPNLAKLTQAGGYGGGRQAIMESEANRNLRTAQNTAMGTGYANAYDKAMQQFNTEQGQAKTLADMMAGQGATDRAIEAEGVAADKAQFEEARANPFKMVQFQQSLLSGMPINAMDYTMQEPSTLQKVASGVSTVDEMLRVLYGIDPAKKK